jgi:hypothetical protein
MIFHRKKIPYGSNTEFVFPKPQFATNSGPCGRIGGESLAVYTIVDYTDFMRRETSAS